MGKEEIYGGRIGMQWEEKSTHPHLHHLLELCPIHEGWPFLCLSYHLDSCGAPGEGRRVLSLSFLV